MSTENKPDIGFRAHDFGKCASGEELALKAKSFLEGSCIQFAPGKVLENAPKVLDRSWCEQTYRPFAENNIRIAVLGCYINPVHPDPEKQEAELRRFENAIENAPYLGYPIVGTETGSLDPTNHRDERNWSDAAFLMFMRNIERLLKKAESYGVRMAIEAVADKNTIDNAERMYKVLSTFKSPNLCCIFDAVNIMPVKGPGNYESFYDETVSMLAPYISIMHVKDFVWTDNCKEFPFEQPPVKRGEVPVGEGLMPWEMIFRLYRKYKVDHVPMLFENFNPQTLRQSIEFVKKTAGAGK